VLVASNAYSFETLERRAGLPVMHLVSTPRFARRLSRVLLLLFAILPFVLLFVPWTQNVHGTGQAIAFDPVQRPQFVVSPIEGRVKKWFVVEGDRVQAGDVIVELVDNDPELLNRLLEEEKMTSNRLRAAEVRVRDIEARVQNITNSASLALQVQTLFLRSTEAELLSFQEGLIDAQGKLAAAEPNYERTKRLFDNQLAGLASRRDVEVAEQELVTARAEVRGAEAKVDLGKARVEADRKMLEKIDEDTKASINQENANLRSAEADLASIQVEKQRIESRIARQRAQLVHSPVNGTIFRLLAASEGGGILVRPGERLAILVPDISRNMGSVYDDPDADPNIPKPMVRNSELTSNRYPGIVAELHVHGNDLPLITKGDPVRLQFEGWPAVQFVGWPSVAVGTFPGRVYLVDPTADENGRFRILVEPDEDGEPWPSEDYLRQGVRAQGWVLLNEVTAGWELWRLLNGFPPVRDMGDKKSGRSLGPIQGK
jgi:membrane fusion protein, adhesin transport system